MSNPLLFPPSPLAFAVVLGFALSGSTVLAQTRQFADALQSVTEQKDAPSQSQSQSQSKSYSDAAGAHANPRSASTVVPSNRVTGSKARGK